MTRDEMIALLVGDSVDRVVVSRQVFWLQGLLENGFSGFGQWSDADLSAEVFRRGLDREDESHDWDGDGESLAILTGHMGGTPGFGGSYSR